MLFQYAPYAMRRKTSDPSVPVVGNDRFEGYCVDLIKEVCRRARIDYMIRPVRDGKYGAPNRAGTWNGMIGELIRGVSSHILFHAITHILTINE